MKLRNCRSDHCHCAFYLRSCAFVGLVLASTSMSQKRRQLDVGDIRKKAQQSLEEERKLRTLLDQVLCLDVSSLQKVETASISKYLVCRFGLEKVILAREVVILSSALPERIFREKLSEVLIIAEEDIGPFVPLFKDMARSPEDNSSVDVKSTVLAPPTSQCCVCSEELVTNHQPTTVRFYTMKGLQHISKWSLRCNSCQSSYNVTKYGSPRDGWSMYPKKREFVEASDCCFLERSVFNWMTSLR